MRVLAVPDERTWALWGHDLGGAWQPTSVPAQADVLLLAERMPAPLHDAVRTVRGLAPRRVDVITRSTPLEGTPVQEVLASPPESEEHEEHDGHDEHGGDDHHDMMAVTGDPSSDGLVMEDVDVELGPADPLLPTGLTARLVLDGDVVCGGRLDAVLPADPVRPDPAAADAWAAALLAAAVGASPNPAARVRSVELERAVALAAGVLLLARAMGAGSFAARAHAALRAAIDVRTGRTAPASAAPAADALLATARRSRALRLRLDGLGALAEPDVIGHDLHGIAARAAGIARDARLRDPAYAALGFEPVLAEAGDAHARLLCRCRELRAALELADVAGSRRLPTGSPEAIESALGPVSVVPGPLGAPPSVVAPGPEGLRQAAGHAVAGLEWSAATAVLASFDLTGWAT